MPRTDAQRRYDRENLKAFSFTVNRKTEADLLEHLEAQPCKASYIKSLIRQDMRRADA